MNPELTAAAEKAAYERGRRDAEASVGALISRRRVPVKTDNPDWRWWAFWQPRYVETGRVTELRIYMTQAE